MRYLDSSAIVKLIGSEPETAALAAWLRPAGTDLVTSQLALTEVARALAKAGHSGAARDLSQLDGHVMHAGQHAIRAMPVTRDVLIAAPSVRPPGLRSLDAIHVATAAALGPSLRAFVTYDDRQAVGAREMGLPVAIPR